MTSEERVRAMRPKAMIWRARWDWSKIRVIEPCRNPEVDLDWADSLSDDFPETAEGKALAWADAAQRLLAQVKP